MLERMPATLLFIPLNETLILGGLNAGRQKFPKKTKTPKVWINVASRTPREMNVKANTAKASSRCRPKLFGGLPRGCRILSDSTEKVSSASLSNCSRETHTESAEQMPEVHSPASLHAAPSGSLSSGATPSFAGICADRGCASANKRLWEC